MLIGYDVQKGSWAFLLKRASVKFDINLAQMLSRIPDGQFESKMIPSSKNDK